MIWIEFLRAIFAIFLIFFSGTTIYLAATNERFSPTNLFFGWGVGLFVLYISFFLCSFFSLPLAALPAIHIIAVIAGIAWCFLKRKSLPALHTKPWRGRGVKLGHILLLFIIVKLTLVFLIHINNPIVDSDATNDFRWVGLAKNWFRVNHFYVPTTGLKERLAPSVISLWANLFTSRWTESFSYLPWFFTLVSMIGILGGLVYRTTGKWNYSLGLCAVLSSIPLLNTHVIRPGYSDIFVAYFFAAILALLFKSSFFKSTRYFMVSLIFLLAILLTKREGMILGGYAFGTYFLLYLLLKKNISLKKIVLFEFFVLSIGYAIYFFFIDHVKKYALGPGIEDVRFKFLLEINYQPDAIRAFFNQVFFHGSFNLYWIFFIFLSVFLLFVTKKNSYRLFLINTLLLFGLFFYFSCFTGNAHFTIIGTNVSRIAMQMIPLGSIVYIIFIKVRCTDHRLSFY